MLIVVLLDDLFGFFSFVELKLFLLVFGLVFRSPVQKVACFLNVHREKIVEQGTMSRKLDIFMLKSFYFFRYCPIVITIY